MPRTYNKGHLLVKEAKINVMKIVSLQLFFFIKGVSCVKILYALRDFYTLKTTLIYILLSFLWLICSE